MTEMPQQYLYGKNRSLISQMNIYNPNQKISNKNEVKPFDNFFRSLKEDKDWQDFCKLLSSYFEGVLSLREFFNLYDEKFQNKVKQEVRDELEKLLPTRD